MKAVVLVGGLGTRLRPLTLGQKKELMPLANRPYLEHALAHLSRHGVTEAILTAGHMAEAFEGFPASGRHGVDLTLVREEEPLDTCGAVKNVEHMLDGTFMMCNGDILTDLDLTAMIEVHRSKGAVATIALTAVEDPSAYGLVPTDQHGRIERFIEKPRADEIVTRNVNAGTYVLEPEILARVPAAEPYSIERQLFPSLLEDGAPLYGFRSPAYWLDIGTPQKYLRGNRDVLERIVGQRPPGEDIGGGVWLGDDVEIDPSAVVRGPVVLGPGTHVGPGARVMPLTAVGAGCVVSDEAYVAESVLHDDVTVASEARVERSALASGSEIGARSRVSDAVIGSRARVGADNELRAGIRVWPELTIPDATVRFS